MPVLSPEDEAKFETVTYTYYEQLNGYEYLKRSTSAIFSTPAPIVDDILKVLDPTENDHPHSQRQFARKHQGQDQGSRTTLWRGLGDWQGDRSGDRLSARQAADGRILRIADLVDDDAAKRDKVSAALKDPAQKQQPRPCRHHHRARHGEGRLRLDLVRTRADGRLSLQPDRNRADHRPRHPRRAGQDPRPLHQPDRRARRLRGSRDRGCQRHAEGHRRQPADGTGAGAALRVHAQKPAAAQRRLRLWRRRL